MNRNKISTYLLGGAMALSMAISCTDLETEERDSVVIVDTGAGAAVDATALLESAYKDLGTYTDQANIYALTEHPSDEIIPPTRGVDWGDNGVWRTLHQHTWDPTHSWITNAWNQLNERAYKCNQILAASPAPSVQQAAEAKFLRALNSYFVVDFFGQLPVRETTQGPDENPQVFGRTEALNRVIKDLEEALPNLPAGGPGVNTTATKAAANLMLARCYLNKGVYTAANAAGPYTFDAGDMQKVIDNCDAVTAAGFSLEPNYFDNFSTAQGKEIVLASPEGTPQNRWYMTLHYSQNPSGWNGFTTLADFYNTFNDPNDQRKGKPAVKDGSNFSGIGLGFLEGAQYKDDGSVLFDSRTQKPLVFTPDVPLSGAATEKGIRAIKYHPANAGKYIILRYGECVTMKAEAQMRKGDNAGALATINALRAARGAAALTSLDEQGMLDERGREHYWEGLRRTDQVRFGKFTSTWSEKTNTEAFRVLYPIPQKALDSNPNLTQNEGY